VEKRKRPLSEGAGTAGKAQCGKEVGGAGAGAGAVKKGGAKCPHNRRRRECKQFGGASTASRSAKEVGASSAAGRASASTTADDTSASNAAGRASASTPA
jgi:hypothetical protein